MKRHSQTKIKRENIIRDLLNKPTKSGSSATNQEARRNDIERRLKLRFSAISRWKRFTTHASFANLKLFCCRTQADNDKWMKDHLGQASQRLRDLSQHFYIGEKFSPKYHWIVDTWRAKKNSHWSIKRAGLWRNNQPVAKKGLTKHQNQTPSLNSKFFEYREQVCLCQNAVFWTSQNKEELRVI